MSCSVLIIEDDRLQAKNLTTYLTRRGYEVQTAHTGTAGLELLERFRPDFALGALALPDIGGVEVLLRIRTTEPHVRAIMMTGTGSVQAAVDAMKAGAYDYLTKPLALKELQILLQKAAEESKRENALSYYQHKEANQSGLDKIIGKSPAIAAIKGRIRQFVQAEFKLADHEPPTVLITGETGTGKELVARAFHFEGPRRDQPFVELNCATIPPHLLEAELFGYERGAFTDAKERKLGLVDAANGGTLFLDEIGEMELGLQAKVLSLLENRRIRRIGSLQEHDVDLKIVAATNRDLDARIQSGEFRSDLYYRLRVIQITLPPLRERGEDVLELAELFLDFHKSRYGKHALRLAAAAREKLCNHAWPGNIRELRNIMEQAVLLAEGDTLGPEHLLINADQPGALDSQSSSHKYAADRESLDLEVHEIRLLKEALSRSNGNVTKAARLLGLTRDTLRYRLAKYEIDPS